MASLASRRKALLTNRNSGINLLNLDMIDLMPDDINLNLDMIELMPDDI